MRSIGRSIAIDLARAGCDVALTGTGRPADAYPDEEKEVGWRDVESVADEIRSLGRRAMTRTMSIDQPVACDQLATDVVAELGRVDVLVNAAASARGKDHARVIDMDTEAWQRAIDINLNGTFYMCRAFGREMVEAGNGGSIVNISSIASKMMREMRSAYSASKVGMNALTSSMAKELGAEDVRVNAICPGYILTSRLEDVPADVRPKMVQEIPLGRAGMPEDISSIVVFLASDQGSWITGQQWNIDGGQVTMH
jgi:3-oxoacyl-[acyl-carrier protein] reductase/meso-butanediol dehydrogenase/(S,S)-butanediol dehydrogenase/diacetyl reductase